MTSWQNDQLTKWPADKMTTEKMTTEKMTTDKMTTDKMTTDKMTTDKTKVDEMTSLLRLRRRPAVLVRHQIVDVGFAERRFRAKGSML